MEDRKTEFEFPLTTPISYARGGSQEEAQFILLKAPSSRNSRQCAALKQAFWRSVNPDRGQEGGNETDASAVITGQDVVTMISMSQVVDLADVLDVAKDLFTKGKVAQVDGEVPLTRPLIDEMSQDDVEAMVGEYLVNFTLASSLAQMKAQSSKE